MSLVDIRVDLPSYSRSFFISVSSGASVRQVKQEIYKTCPGQPRPEGQRLVWRGRLLSDDESVEILWKSDPKIVHLAVHPSAWSSLPPKVSQSKPPSPAPASSVPYTYNGETNDTFSMAEYLRRNQRSNLTYVVYQHQLALSSLSSDIPLPTALEYPEHCHLVAKDALNCNGWIWPAILDAQFPSPSDGGLMYSFTKIDGHPCLRLLNPDEKPTARQEHALKVLTYTFSVLTMSPSPAARNAPPQPISIPPHVNQLLQQMGLPPLRFANNHVQAVANQNNPALREIREIQIRPLIAPLMMLFLRTGLLLYFVAPARKPIFSILIFAWMLYEIWHPIRNVLRNRLGPIGQGQQQERNNGVGAGGAEQAENNNAPPADLGQNAGLQPNIPVRPNALDQQFESIMDSLANVNVANEERFMNSTSAVPPPEPSIGHKSLTFIGLLLSTIHPAIWNRRRVALRRREGTVRTEANARNAPVEPEGDEPGSNSSNQPENIAQIREELRARFERQPLWIQRYVQRVINEDWVDDLD